MIKKILRWDKKSYELTASDYMAIHYLGALVPDRNFTNALLDPIGFVENIHKEREINGDLTTQIKNNKSALIDTSTQLASARAELDTVIAECNNLADIKAKLILEINDLQTRRDRITLENNDTKTIPNLQMDQPKMHGDISTRGGSNQQHSQNVQAHQTQAQKSESWSKSPKTNQATQIDATDQSKCLSPDDFAQLIHPTMPRTLPPRLLRPSHRAKKSL